MWKTTRLSFIVFFLLAGVGVSCQNKSKVTPEQFVQHLEDLGFFSYADPAKIDSLRKNMRDGYDPASELVSIWEDRTGQPLDYRYWFCDNEDLFEEGGFSDMLKTLTPYFKRTGLQMDVTNHVEVWDDHSKWLNSSITLNGRNYTIFKNFSKMGWGEAAQRLADLLNAELQQQQKSDRVFLVNGGNDGRLIFLTEPQFEYIDRVYTNKNWKPLRIKDWCKLNEITYQPLIPFK